MYRYSISASALAFSLALGLLASPALSKSTDEDATTYQVNAAHDGHVDFAAGFNAPLVRAWSYDTGDGSGSYPVIGGGMLFFVGNGNDAFAFNLANGSRVWEHLLPSGSNYPAYGGGAVVFANPSGAITALKARTGKQRWAINLGGNETVLSYPIAAQGMFFTAGSSVAAIDGKTGAVNWSKSLFEYSGTVTYGDDGIYAGNGCDYAKYALNGDLIWNENGSCNGYEDDVAYFGKKLYIYDYNGNSVLSTADGSQTGFFPGSTVPSFFTLNKHSYELVTSNGKIYCLDLRTGNVAWSFQSGTSALPIVINGHPVIANYSTLYILDGATGTPLWSDNVGSQIYSMNAGDGALAVTTGGKVIVYKPQ